MCRGFPARHFCANGGYQLKNHWGEVPQNHQVVAMTQKINAEKLLNVVVADQLKDRKLGRRCCEEKTSKSLESQNLGRDRVV